MHSASVIVAVGRGTYGGELRRRRRIEGVVGWRVLVEQRRQVRHAGSMKALVPVKGSNLQTNPTNHKVLEDPSHCCFISKAYS